MKVNPDSLRGLSAETDLKTGNGKGSSAPAATGSAAPTGSSIELSSASLGLAQGVDSASFDSARVEQIKSAIAQGKFQVNAGAVADKLIASVQDLLGGSSKAH